MFKSLTAFHELFLPEQTNNDETIIEKKNQMIHLWMWFCYGKPLKSFDRFQES